MAKRSKAPTKSPTHTAADAGDGLADFVQGLGSMALKNAAVGVGTSRDQRIHTTYTPVQLVDRATLETLYANSWMGNRIISTLPEDMLRNWRHVKWDDLGDDVADVKVVRRYEKKVKLAKRLLTASKWARLYGGALIVPVLRSQPDDVLPEPLAIEQIEKDDLVALHVFDRWRCSHTGVTVANSLDQAAGMPEHYILAETGQRLHHTRVVRMDGREVPWLLWRANSMWNHSVLQVLINNLKQYDTAIAALTTMMFSLNVDIILQQGLRQTLSQKGGEAKAIERFRQFAMGKSFNGVAVLDKDTESYERHPYTFSGVDKAFAQVMYDVCGAADVPFTRLFGQSPAGMNATGDSDTRNYYDHVSARRADHIDDALDQLDQFLIRSALGHMPDGYESEWCPLWQETAQEKAATEESRARAAQIYWNLGAIDEGVVAHDLYSRGVFSGMTKDMVKAAEMSAKAAPEATEIPQIPPAIAPQAPPPPVEVEESDEPTVES